ncbi:MAG TPA: hypothetical protein VIY08_00660, partial [Candidatus Nitrosocosmicus sp.]
MKRYKLQNLFDENKKNINDPLNDKRNSLDNKQYEHIQDQFEKDLFDEETNDKNLQFDEEEINISDENLQYLFNKHYDELIHAIETENDISNLMHGDDNSKSGIHMKSISDISSSNRFFGERTLSLLHRTRATRLNELNKKKEEVNEAYDDVLNDIESLDVPEDRDVKVIYDNLISNIDIKYLSGDRDINILQQIRMNVYNRLSRDQVLRRIENRMKKEKDTFLLDENGLWFNDIRDSEFIDNDDKIRLNNMRIDLFLKSQKRDDIRKGIDNEDNMDSLYRTGHWVNEIISSGLDDNDQVELQKLVLSKLEILANDMYVEENLEPTKKRSSDEIVKESKKSKIEKGEYLLKRSDFKKLEKSPIIYRYGEIYSPYDIINPEIDLNPWKNIDQIIIEYKGSLLDP